MKPLKCITQKLYTLEFAWAQYLENRWR